MLFVNLFACHLIRKHTLSPAKAEALSPAKAEALSPAKAEALSPAKAEALSCPEVDYVYYGYDTNGVTVFSLENTENKARQVFAERGITFMGRMDEYDAYEVGEYSKTYTI